MRPPPPSVVAEADFFSVRHKGRTQSGKRGGQQTPQWVYVRRSVWNAMAEKPQKLNSALHPVWPTPPQKKSLGDTQTAGWEILLERPPQKNAPERRKKQTRQATWYLRRSWKKYAFDSWGFRLRPPWLQTTKDFCFIWFWHEKIFMHIKVFFCLLLVMSYILEILNTPFNQYFSHSDPKFKIWGFKFSLIMEKRLWQFKSALNFQRGGV